MPRTIAEKRGRTTVPMPEPLMSEVDRVVIDFPEYSWNRQKFVEEAVREKIFQLRQLQATYHDATLRHDR